MSKFNKCALVGAISIAMTGAAMASAVTSTPAANSGFAYELTGSSTGTNPTATSGTVTVTLAAPDIVIGRATGTGQITVSATIVGAEIKTAVTAGNISTPGLSVDAVSSTAGSNSFQFVITPPAAPGFIAGPLFTISSLDLQKATGLQTLGGNVTVAFEVRDTTTGTLLTSSSAKAILNAVQASEVVHTGGNANTINVYDPSLKTKFNWSNTHATLGQVVVSQADVDSVTQGIQPASAAGTNVAGNVAGGEFVFAIGGLDKVKLTLNVPFTAAFVGTGSGFYASTAPCASTIPSSNAYVFTGTGTTLTTAAPISNVTGVSYNICAIANGVDVISAQTIGLTSQIDFANGNVLDPAPVVTASFNVLEYNGSVEDVWNFNPASNPDQQSYLRVTNASSTSGLVTVDGVCDNGVARPTTARVELGGGKTILLTSGDIENGNAAKGVAGGLGSCGGKSRLTVTGEFDEMRVQNFLRNTTSAGLINTNVNNED